MPQMAPGRGRKREDGTGFVAAPILDRDTGEPINLVESEWRSSDIHGLLFSGGPQAYPRAFRTELADHPLSEGVGSESRHLHGMHRPMADLGASQRTAGLLRWVPNAHTVMDELPGIGAYPRISSEQPHGGWSLNHWGNNDAAVICVAAYAAAQDCSVDCSKAFQRLALAKAAQGCQFSNADIIECLSKPLVDIHDATWTATLVYNAETPMEITKRMDAFRTALIVGYLEPPSFRAPLHRDTGRQKRAMCEALQSMRFPAPTGMSVRSAAGHSEAFTGNGDSRLPGDVASHIVDLVWESFPLIFGQPACAYLPRSIHEGPEVYAARVVSLTATVRTWEVDRGVTTECLEGSQATLLVGAGFLCPHLSQWDWVMGVETEIQPACGHWIDPELYVVDDPRQLLTHCRANETLEASLQFFMSDLQSSFPPAVNHPLSQIKAFDGLRPHDGQLCHSTLESLDFQYMGVTVSGDVTAAQLAIMCQVFRLFFNYAEVGRGQGSYLLPIDFRNESLFIGISCANHEACRGRAFEQGQLTTRYEYEEKKLMRWQEDRQTLHSSTLPELLEMARDKPSGLAQYVDICGLLGTPRSIDKCPFGVLHHEGYTGEAFNIGVDPVHPSQRHPSVYDGMDLADEQQPTAFLRDLGRHEERVKEQVFSILATRDLDRHDGFSCMEGYYPGTFGGAGMDGPKLGDPPPTPPPVVDDWEPRAHDRDPADDTGWGGAAADETGWVGAAADSGWGGTAAGARRVRPRVDPWIGHGQDGQGVFPRGPFWPAPRFPKFSLVAMPTETRLAAYEIVRGAVDRWGHGPTAAAWSRERMREQLFVTRKQAGRLLTLAFDTGVFVARRD